MVYLIVIFCAMLALVLGNFAAAEHTLLSFGAISLDVVLCVAIVFVIDATLAAAARALPKRWFAPTNRLFTVKEWERRLYRRLGLNAWKKYVPELGCFTGFHKDHLRDPLSSEYIGRFLTESHYGVVGHLWGGFFGGVILFLPFWNPLTVALPVVVLNFILSNLPTMILRYNTPPLLRLYQRNLARENKKREAESLTEISS